MSLLSSEIKAEETTALVPIVCYNTSQQYIYAHIQSSRPLPEEITVSFALFCPSTRPSSSTRTFMSFPLMEMFTHTVPSCNVNGISHSRCWRDCSQHGARAGKPRKYHASRLCPSCNIKSSDEVSRDIVECMRTPGRSGKQA